jgi:hypothetical protein
LLHDTLYISFGFWGKFLEQNLKATFRQPKEMPDSRTILYATHKEGCVRAELNEQAPRPKTFRVFWPFLYSHYKYIFCTHSS